MDATAAATLFAWIDREVWLVTAQAGARRGGMIATCVGQASIVPEMPRLFLGLSRQSHTWELIEESSSFGLHLLGEANIDWVWRFGLTSGRGSDKFAGLTPRSAATGSPVLGDAIGWLDCRVEARLDAGDRTFYLAEVVEGLVTHFGPPLTAKRVVELAPPEHLATLKRQRGHDGQVDAEAIRAWRELQRK